MEAAHSPTYAAGTVPSSAAAVEPADGPGEPEPGSSGAPVVCPGVGSPPARWSPSPLIRA